MSLVELFKLEPAPIPGHLVRRVMPLGNYPAETVLTEAQIEQRRAARMRQIGNTKSRTVRAAMTRNSSGTSQGEQR